jgi:hypothetical protein
MSSDHVTSKKTGRQIISLVGREYGRWTVIEFAGRENKRTWWLCRCKCGTEKRVPGSALQAGSSTSCGCYQQEDNIRRNIKHGRSRTHEYRARQRMITRCYNENATQYPDYGARGIRVCQRWLDSFQAFLEDMGLAPSSDHSIDRINVNGDYEPSNCRWATNTEQCRNKRNNRLLEFRGEVRCLREWAEIVGFSFGLVEKRIQVGWSVERALTEPPNIKKSSSRRIT